MVVPPTRTITAGSGLTGGGDLSANRTISLDTSALPVAFTVSGGILAAPIVGSVGFGVGPIFAGYFNLTTDSAVLVTTRATTALRIRGRCTVLPAGVSVVFTARVRTPNGAWADGGTVTLNGSGGGDDITAGGAGSGTWPAGTMFAVNVSITGGATGAGDTIYGLEVT